MPLLVTASFASLPAAAAAWAQCAEAVSRSGSPACPQSGQTYPKVSKGRPVSAGPRVILVSDEAAVRACNRGGAVLSASSVARAVERACKGDGVSIPLVADGEIGSTTDAGNEVWRGAAPRQWPRTRGAGISRWRSVAGVKEAFGESADTAPGVARMRSRASGAT